jgi:sugar lactone lactonase YvrE
MIVSFSLSKFYAARVANAMVEKTMSNHNSRCSISEVFANLQFLHRDSEVRRCGKRRTLLPLLNLVSLAAISILFCSIATAQVNVGGAQTSISGPWNQSDTGPVGVASDSAGNIYVGEHKAQDIIRIDAQTHAASTFLTSVCGTPLGRIQFMVIDSSNNLYIADPTNEEIFVYSIPNATCTAYYSASSPFGIALDGSGNIYYTSNVPENSGVYEIPAGSPNGASGSQLFTGLESASGIAFDPTTSDMLVADQAAGTVWKFSAASGYAFSSQSAYCTSFNEPYGLAFDSSKNLLIALSGSGQVLKYLYPGYSTSILITPGIVGAEGIGTDLRGNIFTTGYSGDTVAEISPSGNFGAVPVGTTSAAVSVNFQVNAGTTIGSFQVLDQGVSGLEFNALSDSNPNLCTTGNYASTLTCSLDVTFSPTYPGSRNGAVEVLDGSNNILAVVYVNGIGVAPLAGFSPGTVSVLNVTGLTPPMNGPRRPVFDSQGNLYVADYSNARVLKIAPGGAAIALSTPGVTLNHPTGVALDGAGNLYIADSGNSRVVELTAAGAASVLDNNGLTLIANYGIAVDGAGNVYSADAGHNRVVVFPNGGSAYVLSISGVSLGAPYGVAVDASNNIFIADNTNSQIVKVTNGVGSVVSTGSISLSNPRAVTLDSPGNIYVSDSGNNRMVEIPAGSSNAVVLSTGSLTLSLPVGAAVNGVGDLYIMDANNNRIVVSSQEAAPSLSFASTNVGSISSDSPQQVTLLNLGNSPLTFSVPSSGWNPGISNNFTASSASTCPEVSSTGSPATLAANSSCVFEINFAPETAGSISGALLLTDNTLNAPGSTQTVQLSGTGLALATPTITWAQPSPILFGTALSAAQLNATASVPGTFVYTPAAGTVLNVGAQTLSVTFTPTDTVDYSTVTASVTETVEDFSLTGGTTTLLSATVMPGDSASYVLQFAPSGGSTFINAVTLTLTGLPAGATYTVTPAVIPAGSGPITVTVTVNTAKQQASAASPSEKGGIGFPKPLMLAMFLPLLGTRKLRRALRLQMKTSALLLVILGVLMVTGMTACGSGSGFFSQAPQTYPMTMTGASGALHHSVTLDLTVQ